MVVYYLQGLLVVCKESDVEFFADYSDSDSEVPFILATTHVLVLQC